MEEEAKKMYRCVSGSRRKDLPEVCFLLPSSIRPEGKNQHLTRPIRTGLLRCVFVCFGNVFWVYRGCFDQNHVSLIGR